MNYNATTFQIYTSGGSAIKSFTYTPPLNTWTYICGVISSNSPTTLFVNGQLFGSLGSGGGITSVDTPFIIGASSASEEFFNGYIDGVSLYATALVATNIHQLYAESVLRHVNLAFN